MKINSEIVFSFLFDQKWSFLTDLSAFLPSFSIIKKSAYFLVHISTYGNDILKKKIIFQHQRLGFNKKKYQCSPFMLENKSNPSPIPKFTATTQKSIR